MLLPRNPARYLPEKSSPRLFHKSSLHRFRTAGASGV